MSPLCSVLPRDAKLYIPIGCEGRQRRSVSHCSQNPGIGGTEFNTGRSKADWLFMQHFAHKSFQLRQSMVNPEAIYRRVESSFPVPIVKTQVPVLDRQPLEQTQLTGLIGVLQWPSKGHRTGGRTDGPRYSGTVLLGFFFLQWLLHLNTDDKYIFS